MKKSIQTYCLLILLMGGQSAYCQKYKDASDTGRLNLEYVKLSNEIADITTDLAKAQNKLPDYQSKAKSENAAAQNAAAASSEQATEATNGSVNDAKKAKKRAGKAYKEAKNARSADNDVKEQEEKISNLASKLKKKQERLQELVEMRTAINAKL
ncbi:MAG: hypothetical protein H7Z13_11095 [Ferruginibacter sp.]|nr:hypothetical protein [Ferruginibacter sp.]